MDRYHVYLQKHDMPDSIKQRYGEFNYDELNTILKSLCEKLNNETGDKIVIEIVKDNNIQ